MDPIFQLSQVIISGIFLGGIYALAAIGFGLLWGITRVINAAHVMLAVTVSYIALTLFTGFSLDPIISCLLLTPPMFAVGMVLHKLVIRPLERGGGVLELSTLLAFLGLTISIENVISIIYGTDMRAISPAYSNLSIALGEISFSFTRLLGFVAVIILFAVIVSFLHKTYLGKAVRATGQDRETAMLMGINVGYVSMITMGIAIATTAIAGGILSIIYSFWPGSHIIWLVKAFLVVVLGGVGSIRGILVASILLGLAEAIIGLFLPIMWVLIFAYALLIVILLIRPSGLFGTK
jgi:branched-chain amino acid transport system permease protein